MPLGASRLSYLALPQVEAVVEQRTAVTITANGNAQIDTAQSKFGGSSVYFDGTGDYLSCSNVDSFTGDFTIECWVYNTRVDNDEYIFTVDGAGSALPGVAAYRNGNQLRIYSNQNGAWTQLSGAAIATLSANTWYHLSVSRSGTTWRASVNGTVTNLGTYSAVISASGDVIIGAIFWSGAIYFTGYIDEVRVSNTARYTGSFTPSTTPFVNDANTLLLIHADGTDGDTVFIDDNGYREPIGIQAIGNAAISTTQSKFGSSSLYFDGTGDMIDTTTDMSFGSDDFTIECWVYPTDITNTDGIMGQWSAQEGYNWFFTFSGSGTNNGLRFGYNGGNFSTSSSTGINYNTWTHVAVVRDGTTLRYFINGTAAGTASIGSTSINTGCGFKMPGAEYPSANTYAFIPTMYVDEVRISDTARYTTSFTPSTSAFENDANTLLLLHADQYDADTTVIFDDNGGTLPTYTPPATGTGEYGFDTGNSARMYQYGYTANTSESYTFSCYVYFNGFASVDMLFEDFRNGKPPIQIAIENGGTSYGRPTIGAVNSSNTTWWKAYDSNNANWFRTGKWYWMGVSATPSNASQRIAIFQEVGTSNITTIPNVTNATMSGSFDTTFYNRDLNFGYGGRGPGGLQINGAMSDILFDYGTFTDFSNATTRQKFISSAGVPQDWGSDGSTAYGSTPDVFISGPVSNLTTNFGSVTATGNNANVINVSGTFTDVDGPAV